MARTCNICGKTLAPRICPQCRGNTADQQYAGLQVACSLCFGSGRVAMCPDAVEHLRATKARAQTAAKPKLAGTIAKPLAKLAQLPSPPVMTPEQQAIEYGAFDAFRKRNMPQPMPTSKPPSRGR
jgi:hypothetical protein